MLSLICGLVVPLQSCCGILTPQLLVIVWQPLTLSTGDSLLSHTAINNDACHQ